MSEKEIKENKKVTSHANSGHTYELAFHIVPSLGVQEANDVFENIKKLVEENKAEILSGSEPTILNLEYQMEKIVDSIKYKFNNAYFAWIIFEGGDVINIADLVKQDKNIIRHLLIKTEQTDSIPTSDVANLLEREDSYKKDMYQTEEVVEASKEEEIVDEAEVVELDEVENSSEEESNQSKVDEAIDELIKE